MLPIGTIESLALPMDRSLALPVCGMVGPEDFQIIFLERSMVDGATMILETRIFKLQFLTRWWHTTCTPPSFYKGSILTY
jgi:hypothetical protein